VNQPFDGRPAELPLFRALEGIQFYRSKTLHHFECGMYSNGRGAIRVMVSDTHVDGDGAPIPGECWYTLTVNMPGADLPHQNPDEFFFVKRSQATDEVRRALEPLNLFERHGFHGADTRCELWMFSRCLTPREGHATGDFTVNCPACRQRMRDRALRFTAEDTVARLRTLAQEGIR